MEKIFNLSDKIRFDCSPDLPCFTKCCGDVNIVLTPYDVIRMKNALGISSEDFLEKYAIILYREKKLLPMVLLKMREEDKRCPFITEDGCRIYADRPWACRMFPLESLKGKRYKLITNEEFCLGLKSDREWKLSHWIMTQGVNEYDYMNESFFEILDGLKEIEKDIQDTNPKIQDMLFMSLYNIDKFRRFVNSTTFFQRFKVDRHKAKKIMESDIELFKFAIDWIKFWLFGKPTLKLRSKR